jgi:hypothetical protein
LAIKPATRWLGRPDGAERKATGAAVKRRVDPPPPPPPPLGEQSKVRIMEGESVVFTEESDPQRYVKLLASGEVDATLLDALSAYVKRQRWRLGLSEEKSKGEAG